MRARGSMQQLFVAALVLGAWLATTAGAQTPDPVADLFAKGRAVQASVQQFTARFTETTVSTLLRDPVVATGTVVATKPMQAVLTYDAPQAKTVTIDATKMVVTWPGTTRREETNIAEAQRRVQKYFVDVTVKQLRDSFDMSLTTDRARPDADVLLMLPKRKQIREGLDRLQLWIDRQRLLLVRMQMDFAGGDRKTFDFRDIVTTPTRD